jgi:hypothetical protein
MRLNEFTNASTYTSTAAGTANLLEQIERMWRTTIRNDGVPFPPRPKKRHQNDLPKSSTQR